MYLELLTMSIDYFESIADLFMNTYSVYNDVWKRHEAMFRPPPQITDENLIAYFMHNPCTTPAHNMHLSCQE